MNKVNKPVIAVVGPSNSGKTSFLEKIVKKLVEKDLRVGTIKHTPKELDVDKPGKDTFRHGSAGSTVTVASSPEKIAAIRRVKEEWRPEEIVEKFMEDMDIVLAEGYTKSDLPRIIIKGKEKNGKNYSAGKVLAIVKRKKRKKKKGKKYINEIMINKKLKKSKKSIYEQKKLEKSKKLNKEFQKIETSNFIKFLEELAHEKANNYSK